MGKTFSIERCYWSGHLCVKGLGIKLQEWEIVRDRIRKRLHRGRQELFGERKFSLVTGFSRGKWRDSFTPGRF